MMKLFFWFLAFVGVVLIGWFFFFLAKTYSTSSAGLVSGVSVPSGPVGGVTAEVAAGNLGLSITSL